MKIDYIKNTNDLFKVLKIKKNFLNQKKRKFLDKNGIIKHCKFYSENAPMLDKYMEQLQKNSNLN